MLRLVTYLAATALLVGCDVKAGSTPPPPPNETKAEIRVDNDRRPVDVRPRDDKRVDVELNRPREEKKVDVNVGNGGVKVDVDGKPAVRVEK